MDLKLTGKTFAVGGATSGLGLAIAARLITEGASVIALARSKENLLDLAQEYGDRFVPYAADLSDGVAVRKLGEYLSERQVEGCVFNAGGPPPGTVMDLSMEDWDQGYAQTLRWKVQLTKALLPMMRDRKYGRLLFVESVSIKQPIDNLVLSNAFRAGVAGFVKTLSREEGKNGITVNILAPGYHATPRITSVLEKLAQLQSLPLETVEANFLAEVPVGKIGQPEDFAAMAAFLLSPFSTFMTGETINVDGGMTRFITG